jgi:hypothetical protein
MTLSQQQRKQVKQRAHRCCEYCRLSAQSGTTPFHVDHIIPVKHDGSDDVENLCLACFHCNMYKSHSIAGFDPQTGEMTALFHPRQHTWHEHFNIENDMTIVGTTPIGRTTVYVLKMNLEERVENRRILNQLDEYPCQSDTTAIA